MDLVVNQSSQQYSYADDNSLSDDEQRCLSRNRRRGSELSQVNCHQIDLQQNKSATAVLIKQFAAEETSIALIQEPWINKDKILGLNTRGGTTYRGHLGERPRSCILIKGLIGYSMPQFGNRDVTAVCVEYTKNNKPQHLVVASVYMPIEDNIPFSELEGLIACCISSKLPLVLACDANAHHVA